LPDVPTPSGFALEEEYYPDAPRMAATMRELVKGDPNLGVV
jgi:hypothetical protein